MAKRSGDPGFTLIETLIAITILAIALLAMAPLFLQSARQNQSAFDYTAANALVREKIDELKQLPQIDPATLLTPPSLVTTPINPDPNMAAHTETTVLNGVYGYQAAGPTVAAYTRTWTCINYNLNAAGIPDYVNPMGASTTPYQVKEIRVSVTPQNQVGLPGLRRVSARYLYPNPNPTQGDK